MARQNEHGRLITAAAKAALVPLGCTRKGQSRLWLSDQRFWIISVEFQPSAWSKGSYLNIGARWLWSTGSGIDLSYRPVDFIPFENAEQFVPLIEAMAQRGALEVAALRQRFNQFSSVHQYLVSDATRDGWPVYHAAVVAGLVRDIDTSKAFFRRMEAWPAHGYEWQQKLKSDSAALSVLLDEPARFRSAVLSIIEQRRALIGLPPDPHCLDDALGPTGGP
jgi:hypothetical protein